MYWFGRCLVHERVSINVAVTRRYSSLFACEGVSYQVLPEGIWCISQEHRLDSLLGFMLGTDLAMIDISLYDCCEGHWAFSHTAQGVCTLCFLSKILHSLCLTLPWYPRNGMLCKEILGLVLSMGYTWVHAQAESVHTKLGVEEMCSTCVSTIMLQHKGKTG